MALESLPTVVIWSKRHLFTFRLTFAILFISLGAFNFGYDVALFGSIQGMPAFAKEFGKFNKATKTYVLPPYLSSVMNSTPFAGKLIGTLFSPFLIKRYGRRSGMLFIAGITIIGTILQITSHSAAQYTVGRILCYLGTGVTITVVPAYQSEITPAELRGATVATLQLWIGLGQVIGAVITYFTKSRLDRSSWLIPTGIQFIPPALIIAGYFFVPESPRYLLWNGQREKAFTALKQLRKKSVSDSALNHELDLISIAEKHAQQEQRGRWVDLFRGTNRRRTLIAIAAMAGQQITGQSFTSQYQVVFLQQQKITSPSPFIMTIISSCINLGTSIVVSLVIDTFGRRPILVFGGLLMSVWLFVLGGMGSIAKHHILNSTQKGLMLAALPLFGFSYSLSWAPLAYVTMSEVAPTQLREKTILISTSISVVITFVVSFTLPYLLNAPYANLGAKVGYIYGSLAVATVIWAFFFLPEMKNRTLEELDELFEARVPVTKFRSYKSEGVGKKIGQSEEGNVAESDGSSVDKGGVVEVRPVA